MTPLPKSGPGQVLVEVLLEDADRFGVSGSSLSGSCLPKAWPDLKFRAVWYYRDEASPALLTVGMRTWYVSSPLASLDESLVGPPRFEVRALCRSDRINRQLTAVRFPFFQLRPLDPAGRWAFPRCSAGSYRFDRVLEFAVRPRFPSGQDIGCGRAWRVNAIAGSGAVVESTRLCLALTSSMTAERLEPEGPAPLGGLLNGRPQIHSAGQSTAKPSVVTCSFRRSARTEVLHLRGACVLLAAVPPDPRERRMVGSRVYRMDKRHSSQAPVSWPPTTASSIRSRILRPSGARGTCASG
jgi:hypothetical protein